MARYEVIKIGKKKLALNTTYTIDSDSIDDTYKVLKIKLRNTAITKITPLGGKVVKLEGFYFDYYVKVSDDTLAIGRMPKMGIISLVGLLGVVLMFIGAIIFSIFQISLIGIFSGITLVVCGFILLIKNSFEWGKVYKDVYACF